jgi:hypothetical protein
MIFHAVRRVAGPYALKTNDFTARQDLGGWNREPNDAQNFNLTVDLRNIDGASVFRKTLQARLY